MSVYVDEPVHRYGRMLMCHMVADSLDELHEMADRIGVARRHFQDKAGRPHYDICKTKRYMAVHFGAIETDGKGIVAVLRRLRA